MKSPAEAYFATLADVRATGGGVKETSYYQARGERLLEYLKRVLLCAAPLNNPRDVAWFLASYARDARARLEEKPNLPALEAMLLKRPMVVAYRVAPVTAWLARRLVRVSHFALPNLLAGRELVPEFIQETATVENLGSAILRWLDEPLARARLTAEFDALHHELRRDASRQAAEAIVELLHLPS
jgi:hypothetical protein